VIRRDVSLALADISAEDARAAIDSHTRSLSWVGSGRMWLNATYRNVVVDGDAVGVVGWTPDEDGGTISLLTLDRRALRLDRQVMEFVLRETGVRSALVASWDAHHVALFGAFASRVGSWAYLFKLLDPSDLCEPTAGLVLELATADDLAFLESTGWQPDYMKWIDRSELSVARLDGREVGIAVHERNVHDASIADIGMFVQPDVRRSGIGRSILALNAQQVLDQGRTPVAGCAWDNWTSRATLESAGLVCGGTIFHFELDPTIFASE
jgi:GNAT superfamily N-acetyltransferase